MVRFCLLIILSFLLLSGNAQVTITGSIMHDNILRKYRIHLPPNFDKSKKLPLIFNFHGFTSNAIQQELYSGMNTIADTAGFIVCYPEGINAAWNVGWAFGSTADDIGFTEKMIEYFNLEYNVDLDKIYACGMSNGGFMSYRLGCELNNKICAIASVTGSMEPNYLKKCNPGRSIPIMEIHGTADQTVNYNGTLIISAPIAQVLQFWQLNNKCDNLPKIIDVPNINVNDKATAEKWTYENCKNDHQIVHFKVIGGAHTWPGSAINTGATCMDFNASEEIWLFFKKYSLSGNISKVNEDELSSVEVYPNPFYNQLNIKVNEAETTGITITDNLGQIWLKQEVNSSTFNFETLNFPKGIYILTIQSKKGKSKSIKLVKV